MPAATTSFVGRGTTLGYSTAGTGPFTYTDIGTVVSVSPNITLGEAENIVLSSTFKGYLATLPEAECDFTIQHVPGDAAVTAIIGLVTSGAIAHWQIKFPDAISTITFAGFIKAYNPTFENESIVMADCSLRLSSMPQFATS